ncbi:DUF3742 family protein [Pseudomonas sp. CDFA 602]|uniref:DUF3742 family protein n=1 Tax=Pseudomonas californiensis TaxID=2829823 RepID=UPI001E30D2C9|nr:DUF3742 family protein [Pseudomonas californiensis]MCD5997329.1 DUF3742 family protein [Pseudomonas californiensis]MCD6002930.1 DUF3742 family protein [Pseudomonas californiensis]
MPTQQPVQNSRAHRWAYACGLSVKRGYRRLKTFESHVVERAKTAGVPAGELLVRGSFLTAKFALFGAVLFVSFWLFVLMCTIVALAAIPFQVSDTPGSDDLDDPMHRTSWPERYDKWGSLK